MRSVTAASALLALLHGCGFDAGADLTPDDTGAVADAGPPSFDAGAMAPSPDDDAIYADPSRAPGGLGAGLPPDSELDAESGSIAECFDGLDRDGDERVDCADPDCFTHLRSCCAGRGDCCAAATAQSLLDSSMSAGCSDPAECLAAAPFGLPAPFIVDGALSAAGDGDYDSGVLFDEPVDLRSIRATLVGDFAGPEVCGVDGCFESIAFGFTRQTRLGAESHVEPILSLSLLPSREEVRLRVGSVSMGRWAAETGPWALVATPERAIGVESPSRSLATDAVFEPTDATRVVVWGHNENASASADPGARLRSLALARALCDMPGAWRERSLLRGDEGPLAFETAPSLAMWGDRAVIAYEVDGTIRLSEREPGNGPFAPSSATLAGDGFAASEPELVSSGGELLVFAIDGEGSLVRAAGDLENLRPAEVVFASSDGPLMDMTVTTREGAPSLVMVARTVAGLRTLTSSDAGSSWQSRGLLPFPAIDRVDEIGRASLLIHDGAYVLYVAVRRGTRWQIAQLASDDFVHWRLVEASALGPGELAPLGVRAVDAVAVGDAVRLVGLGWDGVRLAPFETWRLATDRAELPSD